MECKANFSGHIITTAVEHPSVLNVCQYLRHKGFRITHLPVDDYGSVDSTVVEAAITRDTFLISVMLANNEVGTLQPVEDIAEIARAHGITIHTDAVQAVGKIPVDVRELGVDLLSISAHKIGGPKGIGALYVKATSEIAPLLYGGHQERGRRGGTENVPAIIGLGKACKLAGTELDRHAFHVNKLRDRLQRKLLSRIDCARVNGHPENRLPNTLNMSFGDLDGEIIMMNLDLIGVIVSTRAACHSATSEHSHVLKAMGKNPEQIRSSMRISLGSDTTEEDVDFSGNALIEVVNRMSNNYCPAPKGESEERIA
jgi:cysteine desulfurase